MKAQENECKSPFKHNYVTIKLRYTWLINVQIIGKLEVYGVN